MKKAFTMIELIFVIVILGVLSSIAISKMAVTRDDAIVAKGRTQVAAIRNAISLSRNTNILQGKGASWPARLDALSSDTSTSGALFDFDTNKTDTSKKLLDYALYAKVTAGNWKKDAADKYSFKVQSTDTQFTYTALTGSFDCVHSETLCKQLAE